MGETKDNWTRSKCSCSALSFIFELFNFFCSFLILDAAAVVGTKMYVFGGNNGNKVFNDLHCLDTITMKWNKIKRVGNIPCARSAHTMTAMNEKYLVVFGGINENGKPLNDIYIFDIDLNKFT